MSPPRSSPPAPPKSPIEPPTPSPAGLNSASSSPASLGVDLQRRVVDFLERERRASHRDLRDSHTQPVEERHAEGVAICGLELVSDHGNRWTYRGASPANRLRPGDPCWLSDGERITDGVPCELVSHDVLRDETVVMRDRFEPSTDHPPSSDAVLDKRGLDLTDQLIRSVMPVFDGQTLPGGPWVRRSIAGNASERPVRERQRRASEAQERAKLNPSQRKAFDAAVSAQEICLVQGPPGTGKTHMVAAVISEAMRAGEKVLVAAVTHRAINNVLRQVAALRGTSRGIFKIGRPHQAEELKACGIRNLPRARRGDLPQGEGSVVGATAYSAARVRDAYGALDLVILDEAGQVPLPHGMSALACGLRGVLVGDPQQLGPVIVCPGPDPDIERSIFALLADHYRAHLLEETYRMNAEICAFPSAQFYDSRLKSHQIAAARRLDLKAGGRFREVLDADQPSVIVEVDHRARRNHSVEEARVVARLTRELVFHHGLDPSELAVVSPFRAHAGAIQRAMAQLIPEGIGAALDGLVVDTAERIQGQEREVVIYSFGASDPDYLSRSGAFLFDPRRLNVALTRAKTKRIVVGSPEVARARPRDVEALRRAARVKALWRETPRVRWQDS